MKKAIKVFRLRLFSMLLSAFIAFCSMNAFSQGSFQSFLGLGVSAGISDYKGELDNNFSTKFSRYGVGAHFVFLFSPHWNVRATFYNGEVTASDASSTNDWTINRNLAFRSSINEFGFQLVYKFLGEKTGELARRNITPYLFAGVAVYHFNPQDSINGIWVNLQPLGTEGQYLTTGNNPKPYSLTQIAIPFGIGLTKKLNDNFDIGIEVGFRKLFTDYLDDVSGVYPDEAQLLEQEGKLAADLSNRTTLPRAQTGSPRGDPNANDMYIYTNINITYYFTWDGAGIFGKGSHQKNNCDAFPQGN